MLTANLFYSQNQQEISFEPGESLVNVLRRVPNISLADVSWEASTIFVDGDSVQNPRTFVLGSTNKNIVVGKLRSHG